MNSTLTGQAQRYEPSAGEHIEHACKQAAALAINTGEDVIFRFNDIEVTATPEGGWKELLKEWNQEFKTKQEEYRKSPEGIESARKRKLDIQNHQLLVDCAITALPSVLGSKELDAVIEWLTSFCGPADDIGVKWDRSLVIGLFEAHGFKENEHVGKVPEWFNTRERMGRYIVGQAINCMKPVTPRRKRI